MTPRALRGMYLGPDMSRSAYYILTEGGKIKSSRDVRFFDSFTFGRDNHHGTPPSDNDIRTFVNDLDHLFKDAAKEHSPLIIPKGAIQEELATDDLAGILKPSESSSEEESNAGSDSESDDDPEVNTIAMTVLEFIHAQQHHPAKLPPRIANLHNSKSPDKSRDTKTMGTKNINHNKIQQTKPP